MRVELTDCTNVLLAEIKNKRFKQDSVAATYTLALLSSFPTDWKKVNKAIIRRWSFAGLEKIKKMAWDGL